jgi:hypothetical protein
MISRPCRNPITLFHVASRHRRSRLTTPIKGRACDGCTMCCKVLGITELNNQLGPFCDIGHGCKIYDTRPDECRTFHCMWLVDERLSDIWKPDRSKMVLTTGRDGNSVEIRCDPGTPAAWRSKDYYDEVIRMAEAAQPHDGSLYVYPTRRIPTRRGS